jgi:hypothetical protein
MKKIFILSLITIVFIGDLVSQAPNLMSYQAVIWDASGNLVSEKMVSIKISILQGSVSGTSIYSETHKVQTNINGLVSLMISGGTNATGKIADINWGGGSYFLKTETDPTGGNSYTITGITQLVSVPYALHSNTSNNLITPKLGLPGQILTVDKDGKPIWVSTLPTLNTTNSSNVTPNTATSGGNVISDGGSPVTARGVVWSTTTNPTIGLTTKTTNGTGIGNFTSDFTELLPNTTFYVRAYATNSAGTGYGNEQTFKTLEAKFIFVYNLDKSLPDEWIAEFKIIMNNLGQIIPIAPPYILNALTNKKQSTMDIFAWNSSVALPFPQLPAGTRGASLTGNTDPRLDSFKRWMILEIPKNEFQFNDVHRYSVIVHEYFHVYQLGNSSDRLQPKWLGEGGAMVIENLYAQQYYGSNGLKNSFNCCFTDYALKQPALFEKPETSLKDSVGNFIDMNYAGSAFMVLALVKELQKSNITENRAFEMIFKDFWLERAKEADWKKAFTNVFKISVEEFYQRLGKYTKDFNQVVTSQSLKLQEIFK